MSSISRQLVFILFILIGTALLALMAWKVEGASGQPESASGGQCSLTSLASRRLSYNEQVSGPFDRLRGPLRQESPSLNGACSTNLLRARRSVELEPHQIKPIPLIQARLLMSDLQSLATAHRNNASRTGMGAGLTTCTVSTSDDSGAGTLRQCLLDATVETVINFDPIVFPPASPTTIALLSPLPEITTDDLTIDGSGSQVVLDGSNLAEVGQGLVINGANGVIIKGLQVVNFSQFGIHLLNGASNNLIGGEEAADRNVISNNNIGVALAGSGSNNNQIVGNYIGTDATGMGALGNQFGVLIADGAGQNTIGGNTEQARNIISGNTTVGIQLEAEGTTDNRVIGNYIGTDVSGINPLGNQIGVGIIHAENNVIGGAGSEGNLISGNVISGIQLQEQGTDSNQILGNYIGTDRTGTSAVPNQVGITLTNGPQNNIIGSDQAAEGNLISGNTEAGVQLEDSGTDNNQVLGNLIGTDVTGSQRVPNQIGVNIVGVPDGLSIKGNIIGGRTEGKRNIISGNNDAGVHIVGPTASENRIEGNYIGTNLAGTAGLSNSWGIVIQGGAFSNTIGAPFTGAGNLISGNDGGIEIYGSQDIVTTDNLIQANYIGTDLTGSAPLSNIVGIQIESNAQGNLIGGSTLEARNLISANDEAGIWLEGTDTSENRVEGNYIGVSITGQQALGNQWGIVLENTTDNIIGDETGATANIISGNDIAGILIQYENSTANRVIGNLIGTNLDGSSSLANDSVGIGIILGAHDNIIGGDTEEARNVISGNGQTGLDIRHLGTEGNQILGNYIGTNAMGTGELPNRWGVAVLCEAEGNQIGNGTAAGRNIISGNTEAGVQLQDEATGNLVQGNYIGTTANGGMALANRWGIDILFGAKNNVIGGTEEGQENIISGNFESGIELLDPSLQGTINNQIQGNSIGIDANGIALGNGFAGVYLFQGASENTIGPNNTIVHNLDAGVRIEDDHLLIEPLGNTITQNSIHNNAGLPIDLVDDPEPIPAGSSFCYSSLSSVFSGSTCPFCNVEIFANPTAELAGTIFLNEVLADAQGNLTTMLTLPADMPYLSATITDGDGTTSEFIEVPTCTEEETPTSTPSTASATPSSATATPSTATVTSSTATVTPSTATVTPSTATVTPSTATATPSSATATPSTTTATATPSNTTYFLHLPLVIR